MAVTTTNLGVITAYGDAVAAGYTGTKAEWQALMASYATVGQQAVDAKNAAVAAKDTAVAKATEATTAASTATTKASEASASAQSIAQSAAQIQENTDDIDQLMSEITDKSDTADMLKAFPTDTASGSVASFADGANVPVKSLVVDVDPVQDLHGQSAPYPAGGGKNKLPFPYYETSKTANGITFTVNNDGTIKVNGTSSARALFFISSASVKVAPPSGSYTFSKESTSDIALTIDAYNGDTWVKSLGTSGTTASFDFTLDYDGYDRIEVFVSIQSGKTINNFTISPMLRLSSETDATFAPYSNICPISGWSEVNVEHTGKNLLPVSSTLPSNVTYTDGYYVTNFNVTTNSADRVLFGGWNKANAVSLGLKTGTYIWSQTVESINGKKTPTFAVRISAHGTEPYSSWGENTPITINADDKFFILIYYPTSGEYSAKCGIQIELGTTATVYEPYQSTPLNIALGQTVYGGTLDVTNGVLTIADATDVYDGVNKKVNDVLQSTTTGFYYALASLSNARKSSGAISNRLVSGPPPTQIGHFSMIGNDLTNPDISMVIPDQTITTKGAFDTYLQSNPIQICYHLANPITVQLTPHEVTALLGSNNVWADTGDSAVEYRADPTLYIQRLTEPDADMVADANITSGQYFMVGNTLYKATANIASGATISPNVNCTRKSLSEALNELNS